MADAQRLLGLYLASEAPPHAGGSQETAEILVRPATDLAGGSTDAFVWRTRRGWPGARPGKVPQAFGRTEFLSGAEVARRLEHALMATGGARVRLVVASRTGGTTLEVGAGRVRRSSLTAHEAAAALAETGALRQDAPAPGTHGRPEPPNDPPAGGLATAEGIVTGPVHEAAGVSPPLAAGSLLDPVEARDLLQAIGIVGPKGDIRRDERRKYNQISHLVELLRGLLERLPRDRELVIVDAGCGKSQLLLVLNYVLTEKLGRRARLIGLDAEAVAVRAAQGLVRRVGYRNMEFCVTPIRAWRAPSRVDLVLSLHACDTATDEALALGVATGAQGIVAVPCCQHELAPQLRSNASDLAPLLAHPILRARLADWLADGLRALVLESHGYSVDVLEYISPLDTPKNILLRAELAIGGADAAQRAAGRAAEADTLMSRFGVRPSLPGLIEAMRASLKTWT
ncbi:MAG: SAM-dependent methyltransferase [Bacillota bacterium]|nr:SAM-dependent methyltransferase [Bacillota bacterium]